MSRSHDDDGPSVQSGQSTELTLALRGRFREYACRLQAVVGSAEGVTFTGEVGYQPYRDFDFYRAEVRYHQDGGAPFGMISLHGAF